MSRWDEMRLAVSEAGAVLRAADGVADEMARLLRGRLRRVPHSVLKELKHELRSFNAVTREWTS
jgi:hypothetical protein